MSNSSEYIWTDKYKPNEINDIVCHKSHLKILEILLKNNNFPHTIFYGRSGIGKTSTITTFSKKIYNKNTKYFVLELNASDERGIEIIRDKIKVFASSNNLFLNGVKLVILDEADLMTHDAQTALKKIIDIYVLNCRFCIICNNINKIIPEIQSRCMKIRFDPIDYNSSINKLQYICNKEDINISQNALDIIINYSNSDLRKMINLLQSVFIISNNNKITVKQIYNYINIMNDKEIEIFKNVIKNGSYNSIYNQLHEYILKYNYSINDIIQLVITYINELKIKDKSDNIKLINAIIELADLEYTISSGYDPQITSANLVSILMDLPF
jgi:replication factor C subunit 3/5